MKHFHCYDCSKTFQAHSRDDVLQQLYKHYISEHYEIITKASKVEKAAWMERFESDWKTADTAD